MNTVRSMVEPHALDYFLTAVGTAARIAGDMTTAHDRLEEARAVSRSSVPVWAVSELAELALIEGDADTALSLAELAVTAARSGESYYQRRSQPLLTLGAVRRARGDDEGARAAYEESLSMATDDGDAMIGAFAARSLGVLLSQNGEIDRARELFASQRSQHYGGSTEYLAGLALRQGDIDQAVELYREAVREVRDGYRAGIPWAFEGSAAAAAAQGRPDVAVRLHAAAEKSRESYGFVRSAWWLGGDIDYLGRDDYEDAIAGLRATLGDDAFQTAWDEGRAMTEDEAVEYALSF